jgi:hypothetical protein
MGRIDRTVLWILVGVAFVVLAAAALYYANDWWLSGVVSASVVVWLAGVLAAIYGRPERRAIVVGAVLASFLYVLFALGPWFRANVGPWLLTSQALVHVESRILGRQPQVQQITYTAVPSAPPPAYSGGYGGSGTVVLAPQLSSGSTLALVGALAPSASPALITLGHWLCGWLAAAGGALAAAWFTRRSKSPAPTDAEPKT